MNAVLERIRQLDISLSENDNFESFLFIAKSFPNLDWLVVRFVYIDRARFTYNRRDPVKDAKMLEACTLLYPRPVRLEVSGTMFFRTYLLKDLWSTKGKAIFTFETYNPLSYNALRRLPRNIRFRTAELKFSRDSGFIATACDNVRLFFDMYVNYLTDLPAALRTHNLRVIEVFTPAEWARRVYDEVERALPPLLRTLVIETDAPISKTLARRARLCTSAPDDFGHYTYHKYYFSAEDFHNT